MIVRPRQRREQHQMLLERICFSLLTEVNFDIFGTGFHFMGALLPN